MNICAIEKCTGCFACMNICPHGAISRREDDLGKTIPVIDNSKCVECGLCQKTCPQNSPSHKSRPYKCYAVWTKNSEDKKTSSSGGVGAGFARYVLKDGGVVFGTAFNDDMELLHMSAQTLEEARKFRGSKYVSSYTVMTFKEAREYLDSGRLVMYAGTPCQIDGLKSLLRKDYKNLITVDLICHGTPPIKYLKEYAKEVCGEMPDNASFRGKYDFKLTFYKNGRIKYKQDSGGDLYFTAFLEALTYRDNCYACPYAKPERCSDITIGDFWGLDRSTLKSSYTGRISVMLINTEHGAEFFDKAKDEFIFEERSVEEAIKGNGNLQSPSKRHPDRDIFAENYKKYGFCEASKTPLIKKSVKEYKAKNNIAVKAVRKVINILYITKEWIKRGIK